MNALASLRYRMERVRRARLTGAEAARRDGAILADSVYIGAGSRIGPPTAIGAHTSAAGPVAFHGEAPIEIGRWCAIGEGFRVVTSDHDQRRASTNYALYDLIGRPRPIVEKGPVDVGHACWIGDDVTLLAGARVGHGAVVAAGSIVRDHVPPFALVAGRPAKVVRLRFAPEVITRLLDLAWWDWPAERLRRNAAFFELDLTTASVAHIDRVVRP